MEKERQEIRIQTFAEISNQDFPTAAVGGADVRPTRRAARQACVSRMIDEKVPWMFIVTSFADCFRWGGHCPQTTPANSKRFLKMSKGYRLFAAVKSKSRKGSNAAAPKKKKPGACRNFCTSPKCWKGRPIRGAKRRYDIWSRLLKSKDFAFVFMERR